jgi:hypothetical protein
LERSARAGYEAWNRADLEPARAYADPENQLAAVIPAPLGAAFE